MVTRSKRKKTKHSILKNPKIWKLSGGVATVLVVVILLSLIMGSGSQKSTIVYLKGKEIYATGVSKIKPKQITETFVKMEDVNVADLVDEVNSLGLYTRISADGKKIFYFDQATDEGANLYCRKTNGSGKAIEIAAGATEFKISEKADTVFYLKEGNLFQSNLKKSQEVAESVVDYYTSDDAKMLLYLNEDDEIYFKNGSKDAEKIDEDISRIVSVSEECDKVFYLKDDALYQKEHGKKKVEIASDVYSVPKVYESGELYYLKENTKQIALKDYVEDDMIEQDQKAEEPKASDYEDDNEYQDAYYEYYKSVEREEIRLQLEDGTLETVTYEVFYYDGKKAVSVAKGAASGIDVALDNPVIVYSVYNKTDIEKIKLSDVDYMFEVEDLVEEALFANADAYVACGKKISKIQQKDAYDFEIDADGKTIYFIDYISRENNHGNLYKAKISGGKVKKPEKCDSKVYKYGAGFVAKGQYAYYKAVDDEGDGGDFYINKEKIGTNVDLYNYVYIEATDSIVYMAGWNNDKDFGTLHMYNGRKSVEIAKKVYHYGALPNGEVVYMTEYDEKDCEGTLALYKKGKSREIDDGVSAIITITN